MSAAEMLQVKRLQKAANREQTKSLVELLDDLVPRLVKCRRHRSGLKSGRSVKQLLEDLRVHIGSLLKTPMEMRVEGETSVDEGITDLTLRRGFLEAQGTLMMTVKLPCLTILSLSHGIRRYFSGIPFSGPVGQSLVHFIPAWDLPKFSEFVRVLMESEGKNTSNSEFRLLTFRSNLIQCLPCTIESAWLQDNRYAFLFFSLPEPGPPSKFPSNVDLDALETMYMYDDLASSIAPWDLEKEMHNIEIEHLDSTFCVDWNSLWSNSEIKAALDSVSEQTGVRPTQLAARRLQVKQQVKDENGPVIESQFRIKLPSFLGSYESQWFGRKQVRLDGTIFKIGDGTFATFCAHSDSPRDALRITEFKFQQVDTVMRCYHTRSITVTKENRLFQGCVYPTRSGKQQVEFKLVAQRVEENAKE
mmetsp:Transcript_18097/g.41052  ORF Transcript_18097/g.41052 Transcript_18097/m.41052 type:complete len:417 (-) Transcript_18097:167-1417(-)